MSIVSTFYFFRKKALRFITGASSQSLVFAKRKKEFLRLKRECNKAAKELKDVKITYSGNSLRRPIMPKNSSNK